jgi:hypothetical protein
MADAADSKSVFGLTHQNARQRKVACIALQFNLLRDWTKAGPRGSAYAFAEPTDTRTDTGIDAAPTQFGLDPTASPAGPTALEPATSRVTVHRSMIPAMSKSERK